MEFPDLSQHRRKILGARLEILGHGFDAAGLEDRLVDIAQNLAAGIVLEQHRYFLRMRRLDQVIDHLLAESLGAGVPVPGADEELVAGLADEIMNASAAAHHQKLAVELLGVGKDRNEDVGEEGPEHEFRLVLLQKLLELDGCFLRIASRIERDQFELVGGVADLEAAGLIDFVDGDRNALGRHVTVNGVRTGLRLDLPEFYGGGLRECKIRKREQPAARRLDNP